MVVSVCAFDRHHNGPSAHEDRISILLSHIAVGYHFSSAFLNRDLSVVCFNQL
jgi:hypothetical protein